MTTATPARTLDQRLRRSELKADLRRCDKYTAARRVQTILTHPPRWAMQMRVRDLLLAIPTLGHQKVTHTLSSRNIGQHKTITGLTTRQRESLIDWLAA